MAAMRYLILFLVALNFCDLFGQEAIPHWVPEEAQKGYSQELIQRIKANPQSRKHLKFVRYHAYWVHHRSQFKGYRTASFLGSFAGGMYCAVLISDGLRHKDSNLPVMTLASLGAWQGFQNLYRLTGGFDRLEDHEALWYFHWNQAVQLVSSDAPLNP